MPLLSVLDWNNLHPILFLESINTSWYTPLDIGGNDLLAEVVAIIFLTSIGSILISAPLAELVVVCIHEAFRAPKDLFLDKPKPAATRFLSFLDNATSNVAATVALDVADRVWGYNPLRSTDGN
ncbi:hypothetical protein CDL15_Pgr013885 [Punica granatum]|uniref:Uncharacterized protein n=1 Tax=Punica granatum TaxID=22663 RepID=A0A218W982_PUNGR|nr:hypothetical protein CDL15_Pgr013885 [Punica granatum]PKI72640.1 hypothetical protein CRG98_007017 [Punica granatum]